MISSSTAPEEIRSQARAPVSFGRFWRRQWDDFDALRPCMMAAILSDVRFATARTGSSFKCAVPLGGAGLAVPEHLADEIEAVAS